MEHDDEALVLARGEATALPHTLAQTRHLTLVLVDCDAAAGTAVLELHNPDARPDAMVGGLIEDHEEDVEKGNRWRERLHLPEKPVPVDTETAAVEVLHCELDQKLQIGDRVWVLTDIGSDQVTVTPGHDYETRSLVNEVEDAEYGPAGIALGTSVNALEEGI